MQVDEYKNIYDNEESHFFYVANHKIIFSLLKKYLKKKGNLQILDAGCGTGLLAKKMSKLGKVIATDNHNQAIKLAKKRGINAVKASVTKLPFKNDFFDLVTCIDVIYHKDIKSDEKALKELLRVLKPGGILVLRVSANKWLKSFYDEQIHTRERYSFEELKSKLLCSGFEIQKISFVNMLLLPPAVMSHTLEKIYPLKSSSPVVKIPQGLNNLLSFILSLEASLINHINFPFGLGLMAVCKKR